MMISASVRVPVLERSQSAEARRVAAELARSLQFNDTLAGQLAIAVTEAGNNLALHATSGEIILSVVEDYRGSAVEMLSLDQGPGMDVGRCLPDGFSTAGTSGTGLGAIRRLATEFDAWSDASGSIVYCRFERQSKVETLYDLGQVRAVMPGEEICGDNWTVRLIPDGVAVLVSDGLGHGPSAADASQQALDAFQSAPWAGAADAVSGIHAALRGSRGAAIAVAAIDFSTGRLQYAGLGNIVGTVFHPDGVQRMVSHAGTAGHNAARVASFEYRWLPGALLLMHSDGVSTHWSLDRYTGLLRHHPAVIAGAVYRDFRRHRDDATVVALRQRP